VLHSVRRKHMDKIRIPVTYFETILRDLSTNPDKTEWSFTSRGGNVLECKKITGTNRDGLSFEAIDFEYNPGD
jgi:hypothetical protein